MNKKKFLFLLIIVIIIIFIVMLVIINNVKEENEINLNSSNNIVDEGDLIEGETNYGVVEEVTNYAYFYKVQNCILEYLDNEQNYNDYEFIFITNMLELNVEDSNIVRYVARAMLVGKNDEIEYLNFKVYLDYVNTTYSIEIANSNITNLAKIELNEDIDEIPSDGENTYTNVTMSTKDVLQDYLSTISILCLNYPEIAYEYFDNEYKEENFSTITEFENYISKNQEIFEKNTIVNYTIENEDNENEQIYLCVTENGDKIEINEKAIMKFTLKFIENDFEINISDSLEKYINDQEEFNKAIIKYIYQNELFDVTVAETISYELDQTNNRIGIVLKLNNETEDEILAIIDLSENTTTMYDY